jgi:hypothetical protein
MRKLWLVSVSYNLTGRRQVIILRSSICYLIALEVGISRARKPERG